MKVYVFSLVLPIAFGAISLPAQDPGVATEYRRPVPGNGPEGITQVTITAHRLGSDHAEGITTLDMNRDGFREQDGHGIGIADVDGDRKPDILTPQQALHTRRRGRLTTSHPWGKKNRDAYGYPSCDIANSTTYIVFSRAKENIYFTKVDCSSLT